MLCFDQGRVDEAAKHFAKAVRLDHQNADAAYGRALVRERRGDQRGAMRDYVRAWQLSTWYPMPAPLAPEEAITLLHEAADEDSLAGPWLAALPVTIEEVPSLDICAQYDPPVSPSELLGHIVVPRPGQGFSTPCVVLFRANIARFMHNREDVLTALRMSVIRELEEYIELYAVPVDAALEA